MAIPKSLYFFKELLQTSFTESEEDYDSDDDTYLEDSKGKNLKAYMIESHRKIQETQIDNYTIWKKFEDVDTWYYSVDNETSSKFFVIDATSSRVWILYSILNVNEVDKIVKKLVKLTPKLDHCWLSRGFLESFKKQIGWKEKGIGLKYRNILSDQDNRATLSLKAWYGSNRIKGWDEFIEQAKEQVTISSIRWKKIIEGQTRITSEWYNYGKVTITASEDIEETLMAITSMARRYEKSLIEATKLRDESFGAFELNFTQHIDLESFSEAVSMGKSAMNLWLTETESEFDFKRFRGVDMHTWDVVFLDLGVDYAYLTIPGKGCVNAAPRIATIQAENTAGKTDIYFNGDEIFV